VNDESADVVLEPTEVDEVAAADPAESDPDGTSGTPRSPADIFQAVSPFVAFVETTRSSGSGILIDDRHLVTNAHVVWPFEEVRVVFPDGTDIRRARVVAVDLLADIALIEVDTRSAPPVPDLDPNTLLVGGEVFLIGYPAEVEDLPSPSISSGIISRFRTWERTGITFIQTDSSIAGGQSGGALVASTGEIIGLSTFSFGDGNFALATSMSDVLDRAQSLLLGRDVDGLGDRSYPIGSGVVEVEFALDNFFHERTFVAQGRVGASTTVTVDSEADVWMSVALIDGIIIGEADNTATGVETVSFSFESDEPYLITVGQSTLGVHSVFLSSESPIAELDDIDDGMVLETGIETVGNLDHALDRDYFDIVLDAGDTLTISIDTIAFDPEVLLDIRTNATSDFLAHDDDGGGGVFGSNAEVSYTAVVPGTYLVVVDDFEASGSGGYVITVGVEPEETGPSQTAGVRTNVFDLDAGDCFNSVDGEPLASSVGIFNVNVTSCSDEWQYEVLANRTINGESSFPGAAGFDRVANQLCPSGFSTMLIPTAMGWGLGDRELTCLFAPFDQFVPEIGDCASTGDIQAIVASDIVPCSAPHFSELFDVVVIPGTDYPGEAAVSDLAQSGCLRAFANYVGTDYDVSSFYSFDLSPSRATWEQLGDREILCYLGAENLDELQVGTARGSNR